MIRQKYHPIRSCIFTRQKHEKGQLLKFNIIDGKLYFDRDQTYQGRSFYLSADQKIVTKVYEQNILGKRFKVAMEEPVYTEVTNYLEQIC